VYLPRTVSDSAMCEVDARLRMTMFTAAFELRYTTSELRLSVVVVRLKRWNVTGSLHAVEAHLGRSDTARPAQRRAWLDRCSRDPGSSFTAGPRGQSCELVKQPGCTARRSARSWCRPCWRCARAPSQYQ